MSDAEISAFSIGVVGMDQLGAALLQRLDRQNIGHACTDLDHRLVQAHLAEGGAAPLGSPYDLAQMCDLIFMTAVDGETLREAVMGSVGLIHKLRPGTIIVDMSDAPPDVGQGLARSVVSRGAVWVEAVPVGEHVQAINGELTVLFGGPAHVLEKIRPSLAIFASQVMRLGDLGAGSAARLLGTALSAVSTAIHTEMLTFAWRSGLDPAGILQALPLLAPGAGAPPAVLESQVASGGFSSGVPLKRMQTDIARLLDAARQSHAPMPFLAQFANMLTSAAYMPGATGDWLDSMRLIAANAGVRFTPSENSTKDAPQG
ncbi:MAG: NAD(P)-dependent oxidoreductase [Alphaproteobacteria bacterium]|nr:NAD(P)-dependent oxidoreductase [Alphaproteobacteria bacterium]